MTNRITIKCSKCGHEKIMSPNEIADLASRFGVKLDCNLDIQESIKFRCSKCNSREIVILDLGQAEEYFDDSSDSVTMVQCPYDGFTHKKGTLCPNFANHNGVSSHRKKQKANDMYVRKRSD